MNGRADARIWAVVPAHNEASAIANVLGQLQRAGVARAIVIANGCTDATVAVVRRMKARLDLPITLVHFPQRLGHDVPRAIGTFTALRAADKPTHLLYVDGDWRGSFGPILAAFLDHALCHHAQIQWIDRHCAETNGELGAVIGMWRTADTALPNHLRRAAPFMLPLLVRSDVFQRISPYWLHHPGIWFTLTAKEWPYLRHIVFEGWDVRLVGNDSRNGRHTEHMRNTLLEDARDGCAVLLNRRVRRRKNDTGNYQADRRIDILESWMSEWGLSAERRG